VVPPLHWLLAGRALEPRGAVRPAVLVSQAPRPDGPAIGRSLARATHSFRHHRLVFKHRMNIVTGPVARWVMGMAAVAYRGGTPGPPCVGGCSRRVPPGGLGSAPCWDLLESG